MIRNATLADGQGETGRNLLGQPPSPETQAAPVVPAPFDTTRPLTLTVIVDALRPHGAEIREADEWRPLAAHVLGLIEMEREACAITVEAFGGVRPGPRRTRLAATIRARGGR